MNAAIPQFPRVLQQADCPHVDGESSGRKQGLEAVDDLNTQLRISSLQLSAGSEQGDRVIAEAWHVDRGLEHFLQALEGESMYDVTRVRARVQTVIQ